jgi:hypothetical protein
MEPVEPRIAMPLTSSFITRLSYNKSLNHG